MTIKTTHTLLGDKGITSSDANSMCNVAKELVAQKDRWLDRQTVLHTILHYGNNERTLNKPDFDAEATQEAIETRARLYKLVACFRDAIRAKAEMIADINAAVFINPPHPSHPPRPEKQPLINERDIEYPPAPVEPVITELVEESWGREQLTIKQYAEMLAAEAEAAAIGHYIHGDGKIAELTKQAEVEKWRKSDDVVTFNEVRPEDVEKVDELFIHLQTRHRKANQRLNMYRAMVHDKVNEENRKRIAANEAAQRQYNDELKAWQNERDRIFQEANDKNAAIREKNLEAQSQWSKDVANIDTNYSNECKAGQVAFTEEMRKAREKVAALKVVVPADLQDIFDELKAIFDQDRMESEE